jgi:hypothetical protein
MLEMKEIQTYDLPSMACGGFWIRPLVESTAYERQVREDCFEIWQLSVSGTGQPDPITPCHLHSFRTHPHQGETERRDHASLGGWS